MGLTIISLFDFGVFGVRFVSWVYNYNRLRTKGLQHSGHQYTKDTEIYLSRKTLLQVVYIEIMAIKIRLAREFFLLSIGGVQFGVFVSQVK